MAKKEPENQNQEEQESNGKAGRSSNMVVLLLIAVLVILFVFSGAFFVAVRTGFLGNLIGSAQPVSSAPIQVISKEPAFTYEIPEIIVNFMEGDRRRFLTIKFYVGYEDEKLTEELEKRMPEIRDAILDILWDVDGNVVTSNEEKEVLRENIMKAMNDLLNSGKIVGVYFWHVMVQ